jgi:hypothetical protein
MTKQAALKAKKQIKINSLPPALSTRSNDAGGLYHQHCQLEAMSIKGVV